MAPAALLHWASMHGLCATSEARRAFDILRQVRWVLAGGGGGAHF